VGEGGVGEGRYFLGRIASFYGELIADYSL